MLSTSCPSAAAAPRFATVVEHFAHAAALWPDRPALSCGGAFVSYRELRARAARRARRLRALGCGPETLVAVCLERSPELVVSLLAVLESGAAFLPLDPQFPPERLKTLVRRSGARVVVTQRPYAALFETGPATVLAVDAAREREAGERRAPFPSPDPESLAYVIYTSGSTGVPKGVAVTHASFRRYVAWALEHYRLDPGGVALAHTSIGFDLTLTSLFCPLLAGQRLLLVPDEAGLDGVLRLLEAREEEVALLKLTPSHLALMAEATAGRGRPWSCDVLIVGGEQLTQGALRFWESRCASTRIFNEYGPTEATVGCCVARVSARPGSASAPAPIGAAIDGTDLRVTDAAARGAGHEPEGELFIGGASLARGYLGAPAATAEKFVPDPLGHGARLYRTGDRVRRDQDGAGLVFAGRRDRQHKVKGVRVELGEVEAALAQYPGVRGAAVALVNERDGEAGLLAFLALPETERAGLELSALLRFLKGRVLSAVLPKEYYLVPRLPVAASGKVDHETLVRERASYARVADRFVAPRNPTEELLASLWRAVLECEEIGIDDSFFALDGNSMKSIQFVYEARKHGLTLTTRDLFERHTIRQLAELVAQGPSRAGAGGALPGPLGLLDARDRERLPADIEDAYPLALLQAGTLFESGRRPESGTYHNVNSYHLECRLDPEALRRSLDLVAERHPILRTSFDYVGFREPLQLVHREARIPLVSEDISALSPDEQEAFVAAFIARESRSPFDWTRPPLLRFFLHDRGRGRVQFTLSKHHSILDGWSAATLIAEIVRNCFALARGQEAPFRHPVETTYRDFVALERQAQGAEESRAFWRAHLRGADYEALRPWPGEKPVADGGCASATARLVTLGPELSARLKGLATRAHVPLKSVLLAVHLGVLTRLLGGRDVVTGVVSHGRPETTDADKAIGLFINTIPYRQALDERVTWFELARRVFEQEQRVFPHQRYPMARLRREMGWERLFESIFYYTNFHVLREFRESAELRCVSSSVFEETEIPFTAAFSLHPLTSDIGLKLHFHVEHFSRAQIEAVTRWFAQALARCAEAPDEPVLAWPSVTEPSARRARSDAGTETRASSVFDLFRERARARPDAVALAAGERSLTYGALLRRAEGLAGALVARGIGAGEVVGVGVADCVDALVAMLAANRARAAFALFDPQWPDRRLAEVLAQLRPAALIADGELAARDAVRGFPRLAPDAADAGAASRAARAPADPDELAYVVFTSGSTGRPKGVMVSQRGLLVSTLARLRYFAARPYEVFLLLSRLTFDSAYAGIWGTLCGGGTLRVLLEQHLVDVGQVARLLVDAGVTHTLCVPSLYRVLLSELPDDGRCALRAVIVAGEEATRDLVQAHRRKLPGVDLYNEYGPSEVTVWATVAELSADAGERTGVGVPIGAPLEHVDALVLDARLEPLGPGARGELYLGGPALARGYQGAPALTAERFVPNPLAVAPGDPTVLYRTGDLVRQSPEGELEFVGRADNQVKVRGFRIEPEEIERAFHEAFEAREALARVRADASGRKRICLYYVPAPRAAGLAAHVVRAALGERLPAYTLPDEVFEVETLARLPNGKLDRGVEPAARARPEPEPRDDGPANEIEQALLGLWREALGRQEVGVRQSFFEVGGDSLLANQVVLRADRVFGVKLALKEFYQAPTVAAQAVLLQAKGGALGLDFERLAAIWNRLDAAP